MTELLHTMADWATGRWWRWLVAIIPVAGVAALVFWKLWRDAQKIADLEIALGRSEEARKNKVTEMKNAELDAKKAELKTQVVAADAAVKKADADTQAVEKGYKDAAHAIEKVTGWSDVDKLFRERDAHRPDPLDLDDPGEGGHPVH